MRRGLLVVLFIVSAYWMSIRLLLPRMYEKRVNAQGAVSPAVPAAERGPAGSQVSAADGSGTRAAAAVPSSVGTMAPPFRAIATDGSESLRTPAHYSGEVVLLYVFATWCGYCRTEMPEIERLHREYAGRGLRVVAVNEDSDDNEELRKYAWERGLSYEMMRDDDKATYKAFRVNGYPRTVIIDRDGIIRAERIGYSTANDAKNRAILRGILAP